MSDALQNQVEQLIDRSELTTLLYRLGAALDEKRFEDLRTIYAEQAVFEFAGSTELGNLESAIDGAKKMGAHFAHTHHVMTNPIIEIHGDSATLRANLVATHVFRNEKPEDHYDAGIVYHFVASRTAQGWRFSRVKLERIWSNGRWDG
jgi:3-phenylpropionate/cinnamic acid dioxygenase small subunit